MGNASFTKEEIDMKLQILYEDSQILVCIKPAGVPSQSDKTADFDMVNRLKNYLYEKGDCKGQPYIGVVHRLDRPVAGIMVFAKTPFAAGELSKQIQKKEFCKKYLAVVTADLEDKIGQEKKLLTDYLVKNGRTNLSTVTTEKDPNGKKAQLYYTVRSVKDGLSLVEVELLTGRHHQIRVQMKTHLGGIAGDTKYNAEVTMPNKIDVALFAYHLEFIHPKTKKKMVFEEMPGKEPFTELI